MTNTLRVGVIAVLIFIIAWNVGVFEAPTPSTDQPSTDQATCHSQWRSVMGQWRALTPEEKNIEVGVAGDSSVGDVEHLPQFRMWAESQGYRPHCWDSPPSTPLYP
jgi:hypothetical protein